MPWLVTGLGNPGPKYATNRHNIGFMVVDELARRAGVGFRQKFNGQVARARLAGEDALLLQPMTYMNRSGTSVAAAATFFKVAPESTVVVHDELDIPFGDVRLKSAGGHGGHNGLRSIFGHFPRDFQRVRCGIGRPTHGDVSNYVLTDFDKDQAPWVQDLIDRAADAVEAILRDGIRKAMNEYNRRASVQPS